MSRNAIALYLTAAAVVALAIFNYISWRNNKVKPCGCHDDELTMVGPINN